MPEIDVGHLFFFDPFWLEGTPFAINRVVVLTWVAALACMGFFAAGAMRARVVPRGIGNLAEIGYLFVRNNIAIDVIGPDGVKYAPYLGALFFFIFFSNLLEIIPGINFPVTSRMGIPAALAILTWIIFNAVGIMRQGPLTYFKETLFPPGPPKWVYALLTPIEFFSVFLIRPFTLAVRLLANMLAGHVLLTIFFLATANMLKASIGGTMGLVSLAFACIIILFEMLVITIQAYIFTVLTAFYIAEAEHGHGETEVGVESHPPEREVEVARTTI